MVVAHEKQNKISIKLSASAAGHWCWKWYPNIEAKHYKVAGMSSCRLRIFLPVFGYIIEAHDEAVKQLIIKYVM